MIIYTLLYYKHQFIRRLNKIGSKFEPKYLVSWCYLHRVLEYIWFFVVRCWINFKIGFWGSQYCLMGPNCLCLSSYTLMGYGMVLKGIECSFWHIGYTRIVGCNFQCSSPPLERSRHLSAPIDFHISTTSFYISDHRFLLKGTYFW